MPTIQTLFDQTVDSLQLTWLAGRTGSMRMLATDAVAAADLVGHLNLIHPARIQVFGHQELEYYLRRDRDRSRHLLAELITGGPPAMIVAEGLPAPADVLDLCAAAGVPLLSTPLPAAQVIDLLRVHLAKSLSQTTTLHGVLITGESGLGKSELGLELISRGHGLVADDVVELTMVSTGVIEGRCPALLMNLLEVRGLGLLDIKAIFGETAVRRKMRLKLIVHLVRSSTMENQYERLPLDTLTETVLDQPIKKVVIPVAAGRNLAVLLEAAVRNTILQLRGIDTMREFQERQQGAMQDGG